MVHQALNHRDVHTTDRYAHVHKSEVAAALQPVAEPNEKLADSYEVAFAIDEQSAPNFGKTGS